MFETNQMMLKLLGSALIINILALIISSLFYFKVMGPNNNYAVKEWFFDRVHINLGSKPLNSLTMSPNTECIYPYFNVFTFGHPKGDSVNRYCMCSDEDEFPEINLASTESNETTSPSSFSCKLPYFNFLIIKIRF